LSQAGLSKTWVRDQQDDKCERCDESHHKNPFHSWVGCVSGKWSRDNRGYLAENL
jgi:hypothetical protein